MGSCDLSYGQEHQAQIEKLRLKGKYIFPLSSIHNCSPLPHFSFFSYQFNSVQSLSCVWLFATPWTAARQPSLSITNSQSLLKLMSINSGMPSSHLILCRPILLLTSIFPSIRVFSNKSALHIRWPKYWSFSFSFSISRFNEHSGLISFRMDWLDLLQSKGLSRVFSNTTIEKHQLFSTEPSLWSNSHILTCLLKTKALTIWNFVWQSNVSAYWYTV